jgi:hypothetical protein
VSISIESPCVLTKRYSRRQRISHQTTHGMGRWSVCFVGLLFWFVLLYDAGTAGEYVGVDP